MIKVFIADDEIFVVELLINLIDWNAMGLEICGTTNDGLSALNEIKRLTPDIIITDIRMPGINGLDLIQEVQKTNEVAFIIISGHKNFKYAQTAIQFGVKDYILKPIIAEDLMNILHRVIEELNSVKLHNDEFSKVNENLHTAKTKIRTSLLDSVISNNKLPCDSIESLNKEYILEFKKGNFLFIIFKLDSKMIPADNSFPDMLKQDIILSIQQYIQPLCYEILFKSSQLTFYLLCNYGADTSDSLDKNLKLLLNDFEQKLQKFGNLYFTICRGSVQSDINKIVVSYQDAKRTFRARIFNRLNTVIYPQPKYSSKMDLQSILSSEQKSMLSKHIESFDISAIKFLINQVFALAETSRIDQADFYWDLSSEIYIQFLNETLHMGLFEYIGSEKANFNKMLDDCISINAMKSVLIQNITNYINNYKNKYENSENASIVLAKKYISEHYMDKITLNDIAQHLYINPVYFSILFKREVGINFIDYVNKYRVEISKSQLKDISLSISQIAYSVGFSNTKYFSKIFKQIVGITPSQYRRKYMKMDK